MSGFRLACEQPLAKLLQAPCGHGVDVLPVGWLDAYSRRSSVFRSFRRVAMLLGFACDVGVAFAVSVGVHVAAMALISLQMSAMERFLTRGMGSGSWHSRDGDCTAGICVRIRAWRNFQSCFLLSAR